jgi:hypothetical protein
VTLSTTTSGAKIYYTPDGTTPTVSSSAYSSAITVAGYCVSKTIKAVAVESSESSSVSSKTVSFGFASALSLARTVAALTSSSAGFSFPKGITTDGAYLYVTDVNSKSIYSIK